MMLNLGRILISFLPIQVNELHCYIAKCKLATIYGKILELEKIGKYGKL